MFHISQRGSTVRREVFGGLTTFLAMSYILFVQPALLSRAGMPAGGVFMATCIASAFACFVMGLAANYPIAMSSGMGINFFFVYTVCGVGVSALGFSLPWQDGLGLTLIAGLAFLLVSLFGMRPRILRAVPDALKSGIAAGLGLFVAMLGFQWGNLIERHPRTFIALADMSGNYVAALTVLGLAVTLLLAALRIRGAIVLGILLTTLACWGAERLWPHWNVQAVQWQGVVGLPSGLDQTAGMFAPGLLRLGEQIMTRNWIDLLLLLFILLFLDLFGSLGTLVGVGSRAGLMRQGRLPRAERALASDAAGTIVGAALGTSTVTSYIESVTGVSRGARTGLAAVVVGVLMLAALFLQPLAESIAGAVTVASANGVRQVYPMLAPALILIGAAMVRAIRDVEWDDATESLPAFLAMATMPFTFSIFTGIAVGFISYAFAKLLTGRIRQCPLIVYVMAALFVLRYVLTLS